MCASKMLRNLSVIALYQLKGSASLQKASNGAPNPLNVSHRDKLHSHAGPLLNLAASTHHQICLTAKVPSRWPILEWLCPVLHLKMLIKQCSHFYFSSCTAVQGQHVMIYRVKFPSTCPACCLVPHTRTRAAETKEE